MYCFVCWVNWIPDSDNGIQETEALNYQQEKEILFFSRMNIKTDLSALFERPREQLDPNETGEYGSGNDFFTQKGEWSA